MTAANLPRCEHEWIAVDGKFPDVPWGTKVFTRFKPLFGSAESTDALAVERYGWFMYSHYRLASGPTDAAQEGENATLGGRESPRVSSSISQGGNLTKMERSGGPSLSHPLGTRALEAEVIAMRREFRAWLGKYESVPKFGERK